MNQVMNYGRPIGTTKSDGARTSKGEIPLGQYFSDGQRMYRWAHINTACIHGQVACQNNAAPKALTTSNFQSATDVLGYGGSVGDTKIRLYGVSAGLSVSSLYEDGTFEIYDGIGEGYSYVIDHVQEGGTGRTILALKEGLAIGLTSTLRARLRPNKYKGLLICSAYMAGSAIPVGALTDTISVSGYQLVQTKGVGMGIGGATAKQGMPLFPGASGLMQSAGVLSAGCFGHALDVVADGTYFAVDWDFE